MECLEIPMYKKQTESANEKEKIHSEGEEEIRREVSQNLSWEGFTKPGAWSNRFHWIED